MHYNKLMDTLQNLIDFRPSQANIAKIIGIGQTAMSGRASRNSSFSEEELLKISAFYGIDLLNPENCVELDYIRINPSCGRGTYVMDEAEVVPIKLGKELIQNLWKTSPENLKLFKAAGDSMEPLISDDDVVVVDITKNDYHNAGIYLISIDNNWFIKRLNLRLTGELDIISENKAYPIETLTPDNGLGVIVRGKVIQNLSKLL